MNYWEYLSNCKALCIPPRSEAVFSKLLLPIYSLIGPLYENQTNLILATNEISSDSLINLLFYSKK